MTPGYRSNDAVITICQNNDAKSIEITDVNETAEDMIGYSNTELKGKHLQTILPPRIGELFKEYVEFEANANDVGEVLGKVQNFSAIDKEGKEIGYRMKVVRTESTGARTYFKLILQDQTGLRKNEALRRVIQENFRGHEALEPETLLPNRQSLGKDIELMGYYNNKSGLHSCFAIMQIDHYDELFSQYGRPNCIALVKHVAFICRQNLRPDDVVGSVNYKRLGVLLLDTTAESARMVFNRLRWQIAANPFILPNKMTLGISVSVSFSRVGGRLADKAMIDECDAALDSIELSSANVLIEVEEASKKRKAVE